MPDLIIIDYMWPGSDDEWTLLNLLTIDRRTRPIPAIDRDVVCDGVLLSAGDTITLYSTEV